VGPYSPAMTQNRNDNCIAGRELFSAMFWFEEHAPPNWKIEGR
jgi:hypothetical protein